tara:strand:+ start:647 stop:913 length:267 start_codon:yes stop_codon:yes gene_type:complete
MLKVYSIRRSKMKETKGKKLAEIHEEFMEAGADLRFATKEHKKVIESPLASDTEKELSERILDLISEMLEEKTAKSLKATEAVLKSAD